MKKEKKTKVKKTAKQRFKSFLKGLMVFVLVVAVLTGILTCVNIVGTKSNSNFVKQSVSEVKFNEQLVPEKDKNGNFTFTTDRDFRIMQLTDIHLGTGFLSIKKDSMALNAVAAMISAEKPDLVVVTGDVAYPVPFQAGTINNKRGAILFAELMEKLGVYWCVTYGNHDTEAYSFFAREDISEIYGNHDKYPHSLFSTGPDSIDGYGNYVINVKNSAGKITQSLFMIDSHSYTDNDYFGIMWKYDCVHKNQIEWYKQQLEEFKAENKGDMPKSLMFMHIPVIEFRDAMEEYKENGFKDTVNTKYIDGKAGEKNNMVYSSSHNNGLFDACREIGSTQGMFFGHDHLNNIALRYKGMYLSYAYSVDYLAYAGISKFGAQRGCNIITTSPDGSFKVDKENYYQDKYQSINAKESVTMDDYN
ncbi:MAG: metallophosphoesterase [Clostridia bacterium]|nr:metallophosphoesterase [Clostridia bacterium]